MNQEVVKNFLNLPGLVGLVLADERSRPYFYSLDQMLNGQQRELVTKGIWQIIASLPSGIESFEFQFVNYRVYIYRLNQELILMTLMEESQANTLYTRAVDWLRQELLDSSGSAIANFRLAASKIAPPLSPRLQTANPAPSQPSHNPAVETHSTLPTSNSSQSQIFRNAARSDDLQPPAPSPTSTNSNRTSPKNSRSKNPSLQTNSQSPPTQSKRAATPNPSPSSLKPGETSSSPSPVAEPLDYDQLFTNRKPAAEKPVQRSPRDRDSTPQTASAHSNLSPTPSSSQPPPLAKQPASSVPVARTIAAYVTSLNRLSEFTRQFLGTAVVCNYLKSTRPKQDWLQEFQVDRAASIQPPPGDPTRLLTPEQQAEIRTWVNTFMNRCSSVIRDFPTLVQNQGLTETDKVLLLSKED